MAIPATLSGDAPRRSPVRLLSLHFLLQKASNNLLYLSLLTIFLKNAGAESLPWVYVLVNVFFIFFQFVLSRKASGLEGHGLLSAISWPALVFSIVAGAVVEGAAAPILLCFLILSILTDLFTSQSFANMANQFLPLQEAKQSLPGIYAAGSLGYILSGILLKFVMDIVGIRGLLWFTALLIVIQQFILGELEPYEIACQASEPPAQKNGSPFPQREQGHDPELISTWNQPLVRLLMVSSFLILFNKYLIDFLFARTVSRRFPNTQDLAVFLGVFGAAADLTVIGLQTLVMNQVFSLFPIGRVLMAMPGILIFLCFGATISLTFVLIVTIQFFVLINSKNFAVPATTILLSAVRNRERGRFRRDIGIVCSASSMLVGGVLLAVRSRLSPGALFAGAAVVYGLMAWVHYRLDRAYAITIRKTISDNPDAADAEWLESLRFLGARERFNRIQELLHHADPAIRKGAIGEAALLPEREVKELLLPMLTEEKDAGCLGAVSRTILEVLGPDALCNLEILLAGNEDPRLSADIIEVLGQFGSGEPVEDLVELFLSHEHHRIRGSAAMSMLRLTRRPERLEAAMKVLATMARDRAPLPRATAAAVMGEQPLPLFIPALEILSNDSEEVVARNALQSLAKMRTSRALGLLEKRCRHPNPRVAEIARTLFRQASRQGLERVGSLMKGFSGPERQHLAQTLKTMRGERLLDVLARTLSLEHPAVREGMVHLLQEADEETVGLIDKCLIEVEGQEREGFASVSPGEDGREVKLERERDLEQGRARISVTMKPIWEKASTFFLKALPKWSQLLPFLAIESSAADEAAMTETRTEIIGLLRRVWLEGVALEHSGELVPGTISAERLPGLRAVWSERIEVCARLIALSSTDPSPALRAIDQFQSRDPFTRSVAQELLETQFGMDLASWLIPLLKISSGSGTISPGEFSRLAKGRGLGFETPDLRERFRPLLEQIINAEAPT